MPGDNFRFCCLPSLYLGNDLETGIVGWGAVWARCTGLSLLYDCHPDTVFWAVVAGIPGRQRVGTDVPGIGYGHIGTERAIRVTARPCIARRDMAIQQEGNRRITGKFLSADM